MGLEDYKDNSRGIAKEMESEALIQKSLAHLVQGRTTIVIAHRLSSIKQAEQILVIQAGSIAERGTHEILIVPKGRYYISD